MHSFFIQLNSFENDFVYMAKKIRLQRTIPKSKMTSYMASIRKAVIQNRDPIMREIEQTRELYDLMVKWSSGFQLSESEKKKVKAQLIDICKTIPTLAVFLMPFGGIVLYFLIKYLPFTILPDSFDDLYGPNAKGEPPPSDSAGLV